MSVLVTGGAGYIGSHAVNLLIKAGKLPVVVDNLSRGNRESVPEHVPFYECDINETERLIEIIKKEKVREVIHFAALAYVGESVFRPLHYYLNNVSGTLSLLNAMQSSNVRKLVFSSTCATYGEPETLPITEETPQHPINPYGRSKLMVEQILRDLVATNDEWSVTALRYFNVAGCSPDGLIGEKHDPETHLIPILLQVAFGKRESVTIFGKDYDTPDGTCIRDYIHVDDLCKAHLYSLRNLRPNKFQAYNLGIGKSWSVLEVVKSVERVTGKKIPVVWGERREGDPPVLFSDSSLAQRDLGWYPDYPRLNDIVWTAWNWFRKVLGNVE